MSWKSKAEKIIYIGFQGTHSWGLGWENLNKYPVYGSLSFIDSKVQKLNEGIEGWDKSVRKKKIGIDYSTSLGK